MCRDGHLISWYSMFRPRIASVFPWSEQIYLVCLVGLMRVPRPLASANLLNMSGLRDLRELHSRKNTCFLDIPCPSMTAASTMADTLLLQDKRAQTAASALLPWAGALTEKTAKHMPAALEVASLLHGRNGF